MQNKHLLKIVGKIIGFILKPKEIVNKINNEYSSQNKSMSKIKN